MRRRTDGFYGGVSYRDNTPDAGSASLSAPAGPALSRTPVAVVDDTTSRALLFGGYRWQNDLAVEAVVSARSTNTRCGRSTWDRCGAASDCASARAAGDVQGRSLNLDVVHELDHLQVGRAVWPPGLRCRRKRRRWRASRRCRSSTARGVRDGMNYGVGMRYDMNSALGLRLEYSRFGRFAGEFGTSLPETDQVTLGVQFRF